MMTNNHVFRSAGDASTSVAQFDYVTRSDGADVQPTEFEFEPTLFFKTSRLLDFTVVAVADIGSGGARLADRPWNALIRESGKALVGEPVNIIQHPKGDPMKVAFRDNKIIDRLEDFLHYKTDTQQGSSGSEVCNDRWDIAALHHSGVPQTNSDGAILLQDGRVWDGSRSNAGQIAWIANEGVRISRIVAHLDGIGMTPNERFLYEQCFIPIDDGSLERRTAGIGAANFVEEDGFLRKIESDGTVSWYFRVNFGPMHGGAMEQGGDQSESGQKGPMPGGSPAQHTNKSDLARSRAEELLERFKPELPYYDAVKDGEDIETYYSGINFNAGAVALFNAFSKLVDGTHHTELSYKSARLKHLYPWVDLRENGDLRNIYSGTVLDAAELIAQELERFELARPGFLSDFSAEIFEEEELDDLESTLESTMPFNCEHVVPQSWFQKRQPMKADLHHLFTCEPSCNSFRSNIPYFDFDPLLAETPEMDLEIVRRECGQRVGDKFEPEMSHGAVARATLYFLLRYPDEIGDENRELQKDRLDTLIDWHFTQKPSRYEKHRNQAIFAIQGNRNPLIDHPDVAEKIRF